MQLERGLYENDRVEDHRVGAGICGLAEGMLLSRTVMT